GERRGRRARLRKPRGHLVGAPRRVERAGGRAPRGLRLLQRGWRLVERARARLGEGGERAGAVARGAGGHGVDRLPLHRRPAGRRRRLGGRQRALDAHGGARRRARRAAGRPPRAHVRARASGPRLAPRGPGRRRRAQPPLRRLLHRDRGLPRQARGRAGEGRRDREPGPCSPRALRPNLYRVPGEGLIGPSRWPPPELWRLPSLTADPNRRARAAIAALLFLLPAGSALLHVADAASGTNVVTDPAGDNTGGGPQADVLRVGASNDASKLYFYVEVGSTSPPAADVEYQVDFTAPGQPPSVRQYSIVATYSASGSMGPATLDFLTDVTGSSARTEQASIVGDEIVFAMSRADVSSPPTGATFTAIDALTYPPADPTTTWDDTSSGSYTMAAPTPATPSAPSITGAAGSPSSVALSWSAPASSGSSSVTGYKVYRGTTSGGETLLATLGNVLSYADSAVSAGQTYFYQVSAVNSAGEGPRSAEASATVAAPTLPGAVQGLSATAGDGKATLSWSAPASDGGSPITAYQVFQGSAPGAEGPTAVATVAGASATLTGLANGQTYYFRVRAQNAVGLGPEGSEVTVTPSLADAPTAFEDYHNTLGDTSSAGEPSLGVDQETGAVLYTSGFNTYKITNLRPNADARTPGAATWADVSNVKFAPTVLGDPIGWLDRHTNRFFQAELLVPPDCSQMGYTDDGGATWNVSDGSCNTPNGEDHETVGGGPFHGEKGPQLGSAYPDSVYYCTQANALATCAVSEDGGVTFQPARVIYHTILNQNTIATADGADPSGFCFNLHGHVKVSPTGIAAVPNKNCYTTGSQETKGGVTTSDDGNTWRIFSIPSSTQDPNGGDDDPSLDWSQSRAPGATHDRLWYGYYDGDHHMKIAHSDDLGATWSPSFDVGASLGLVNTKFPEVVAGDWDRAAIAFLGSATAGDNQASGFNGVW